MYSWCTLNSTMGRWSSIVIELLAWKMIVVFFFTFLRSITWQVTVTRTCKIKMVHCGPFPKLLPHKSHNNSMAKNLWDLGLIVTFQTLKYKGALLQIMSPTHHPTTRDTLGWVHSDPTDASMQSRDQRPNSISWFAHQAVKPHLQSTVCGGGLKCPLWITYIVPCLQSLHHPSQFFFLQ